jgi:hypothetical protein
MVPRFPAQKFAHKGVGFVRKLYIQFLAMVPDSALPRPLPGLELARAELAALKDSREAALARVRAAEADSTAAADSAAAARHLEAFENLKQIECRMISLLLEHDWTL